MLKVGRFELEHKTHLCVELGRQSCQASPVTKTRVRVSIQTGKITIRGRKGPQNLGALSPKQDDIIKLSPQLTGH